MMARLFLVLFLLPCFVMEAQETVSAKRINGEINFDGIPDEEMWKDLEVPYVQHQPVFNGEDYKGNAFIAYGYDDNYIWVAGILEYEEGAPRAVSMKRDHADPSNDYFGILIDSYNDNENALCFMGTPSGVRWDAAIFNDAQGQFPLNLSWNTFWDLKSVVEENKWYIEIRIPLSSIKFQDYNGLATMGISLWWYNSQLNQTLIYPEIDQVYGEWSAFKPSKYQDTQFEGIYSKNPIYLSPFGVAGYQRSYIQDDLTLEYNRDSDDQIQFGGDAKITIGDGWTLDLTANTDFAQAEADDQQVNLTRFSLFFPEKRQFFQERSSIFEVSSGYINRLFYSRTIGLDDNFNIVPILGGARLVGRAGKWDVALLDMQTRKTDDQLSSNYGVIRLRKQVSQSNSYLGGIATNKLDSDGNLDATLGMDGIFDLGKNNYLNLVASAVLDTAVDMSFSKNTKFLVYAENRATNGFLYNLTLQRTGEYFLPAMGFERRPGTFKYRSTAGVGWFAPEASNITNSRVEGTITIYNNLSDNRNDTEEYQIRGQTSFKAGGSAGIEVSYAKELIRDPFDIYGIMIDASTYSFPSFQLNYETTPAKRFILKAQFSAGKFYDGNNINLLIGPEIKPGPKINISGGYNLIRMKFTELSLPKFVHFANVKTDYSPTNFLSFALLSQYNSYSEKVSSNFRFRYNPREGIDLFVVINSFENTNRNRYMPFEPMLPVYDTRAFIIKYIYTFIL